MTYQVPTTQMPTTLVVGDTWSWRVPALADYPAATWTLSFAFAGPDKPNLDTGWTITPESAGSWLVAVTAATTLPYKAGRYQWVMYVTSGLERHQVASGWVTFGANVAQLAGDQRSHSQKMLELCEAALQGRILTQEESYAIGARSLTKTPLAELQRLRGIWAAEVWKEQHPGQSMPSVGVRFQRAR